MSLSLLYNILGTRAMATKCWYGLLSSLLSNLHAAIVINGLFSFV